MSEQAKRVLVLCAHPDDVEAHAAGTIATWVDQGWAVRYVIFTSGDKGADDPHADPKAVMALREAEQLRAAEIIGVEDVVFLRYGDGDLAYLGEALVKQATVQVRAFRPHIVMTHDPYAGPPDYLTYQLHPDHRALGFAVLDAVYFRAPGPLFYPEQLIEGLHPHRTDELYLFMGSHVDHYVDISATLERKIAAVRAHVSQWGHRDDVADFFRARAERSGRSAGYPLAEAFKRLAPS